MLYNLRHYCILTNKYGYLFVAKMYFPIQRIDYSQWKIFEIQENISRFNKKYLYSIKNIYIQLKKYLTCQKIHLYSMKYICIQRKNI